VSLARASSALGLGLRERERIGARRPLASVTVVSHDPAVVARLQRRDNADILGELNVKQMRCRAMTRRWSTWRRSRT
jgi:hypothetical protein